ncbi:response regulator transcription factor [Brevundimonas sp.]|jgi:two-component system, OmpR family, response regulator|uniref:response regulator transcription factor n=1 Tax=Brevundimonas sp. TaxID=1871086 RepID=UPI0017A170E8|nr:response regulator transcription factor [Brevundimonas sp.]MBA4807789.1 response regulator transcription factor [Brevundimonas sp.]
MTPHTPAILIFERQTTFPDGLRSYLCREGFEILDANTPDEMEQILSARDIRLTLMDIDDADLNALSLCRDLRGAGRAPILATGTRNTVSDRVAALDMGADRYLARPFSQRELLAHVRSLARPLAHDGDVGQPGDLCFRGWRLQPTRHKLFTPTGDEVVLTHREFRILSAFLDQPRTLLTRAFLKETARIDDTGKTARIIDLMIYRLRRKLKQGLHGATLIHTRHDKGYVFTAAVVRQ